MNHTTKSDTSKSDTQNKDITDTIIKMMIHSGFAITPPQTVTSPFQEHANNEGFRLEYVQRSYEILSAMNSQIPNYYELCEKTAREQPELAADLYKTLRDGMHLTPEQFAQTHNFPIH